MYFKRNIFRVSSSQLWINIVSLSVFRVFIQCLSFLTASYDSCAVIPHLCLPVAIDSSVHCDRGPRGSRLELGYGLGSGLQSWVC